MRYDLADLARRGRGGNRRPRSVTFRPIMPTQAQAADLYARCYRPIITLLTARLPELTAAYERSLPMRDGVFHDAAADDVQSVLSSIGDALNRLILTLAPGLELWARSIERNHRERWRSAVLTATGIDTGTLLLAGGEPTTVQQTIDWNVALMRDVSAQAQARMSAAVFQAFQARVPAATLAKDIRSIVSMGRSRSLRIASDQLRRMSATLDRERQNEAGITRFKWKHSAKLHPRPEHVAHDGKIYSWDDLPLLGGKPDYPGLAIACGCRSQAVLDL